MDDAKRMRDLLERAVYDGNKSKILELIQQGIEWKKCSITNYYYAYGDTTILHVAFKNQDLTQQQIIEILQIFLDRGVDPDITNGVDDITVLHVAVQRRMQNVIEFLKNRGADLNAREGSDGNSIVHFFIEYESKKLEELRTSASEFLKIQRELADFIDWLASTGFDIHSKNRRGLDPLHFAISSSSLNWLHVVPTLLKHTKRLDLRSPNNKMLLHSFFSSLTELRYVIRNSDLFFASNYANVVKILLDKVVPIGAENEDGNNVLHVAIRQKEDPIVLKMLIDRYMAADHGIHTVSSLINYAIRWWNHEEPYSYSQIILGMIRDYPNVLRPDIVAITPIQSAVANANLKLVQLLKHFGDGLFVISSTGGNLLHFAAYPYMIRFLLSEGVDIDGVDHDGNTPLCIAIAKECERDVSTLLEYGADVNNPVTVDIVREERNSLESMVLLRHVIKFSAAGLQYDKGYQSMINAPEFNNFRKKCQEEIKRLKSHFIDDDVSLLHFLQINRNRKCAFASNVNLKNLVIDESRSSESFGNNALNNAFPNYSCFIKTSYSQAVARKPLLEAAESTWYELTKIDLPSLCVDRILLYLSNKDLSIMVK